MGKFKDETGNRFGMLTVIKFCPEYTATGAHWLCRCDCGGEKIVLGTQLRNGTVKSCGCLARVQDLTGRRFGRLVVLERAEDHINLADPDGRRFPRWRCQCDCGEIKIVLGHNLKEGTTRSCGCLRRETSSYNGKNRKGWRKCSYESKAGKAQKAEFAYQPY